ncbi:unnamed protein product [Oikopleura dioica]|uniref:Uncharacterized protein n=1 Tax=Oikopleura dioica TaxID=34765 RepID=E4X144_OIKDI|nr:unnamed protein product [Oikopleura dioica]
MSSIGSYHEREFWFAERRDSDVLVLENFQNDALWRNFSQPDAQEKSRKSRKVSIERWHHIQEIELENGTEGFKRPRRPKITFEGHILLFDTCRAGNEDELLYLISNGVDVNSIGPTGETALIICAAAGHARLALHLVRGGANVDVFDGDGWTALHHACYHDHYSVMLQLLEAKANVFAVDFDLNFPINHIRHNSPLLLTMNRQMTSRKGINPEVIRGNHSRILNEMTLNMIARTKKANCFISGLKDFRNEETGVTLAHCLASYGLNEALQVIIDLDKDVVNKVDYSGFTPLHCAAKFGQLDCLKVLLKAGADVKSVDKYQMTARHYCFQPEGRALLDGVPVLNEVDGAATSKKSKKGTKKKKIDEAPRKPKESIKRLQKSISKKESNKFSNSGGGVCSKFM